MAKKTIFRASISNIGAISKWLDKYADDLERKGKKLIEALAKIGYETASVKFASAVYDGHNDVKVEKPYWKDDKTLVIRATGNAVAFIEFGTGIMFLNEHPKAEEFGAIHGTFGQGKGKHKAWGYYGTAHEAKSTGRVVRVTDSFGEVILTQGNPANYAMYDAGQDMRAELVKLAQEIFGKYD